MNHKLVLKTKKQILGFNNWIGESSYLMYMGKKDSTWNLWNVNMLDLLRFPHLCNSRPTYSLDSALLHLGSGVSKLQLKRIREYYESSV